MAIQALKKSFFIVTVCESGIKHRKLKSLKSLVLEQASNQKTETAQGFWEVSKNLIQAIRYKNVAKHLEGTKMVCVITLRLRTVGSHHQSSGI